MDVYINDVATTSNIPIIAVEKFYFKRFIKEKYQYHIFEQLLHFIN